MKSDTDETPNAFGLLATGSAECWSIDVDESHDGTEWSLQLDGPKVYIAFALHGLGVVRAAVDYLRSNCGQADAIPLGYFASSAVSLHWDNEYPDRCFLIIATDRSALRITLSADDTAMLADALEQVLEDLPDARMK